VERLKTLLRLALTQQAHGLVLQSGQIPELVLAGGRMPIAGQEPFAAAHVQSLFSQLLPIETATIAAKQPVRGYLQIPNVGRIELLALPSAQPCLRLYLPNEGQALFAAEWAQFGSQPPVLAQASGQSFAPQVPAAATQIPEADPGPPPNMGFIPAALVGHAPDKSTVPSLKKVPPMPAQAPTPAAAIAPPRQLQAPTPMPIQMPPQMPPPPPLSFGGDDYEVEDHPPVHVVKPQPNRAFIAATRPEISEESPPTISFGPDLAGSAGVSDGDNPIDAILIDMIKRKASDVHMTCGEPLCMRIDGDIDRVGQSPLTPEELERLLLPMIPGRNLEEFSKINDTDFAYEIRGVGRFRVNLFRDKNGVGSVMRHIPSTILTAAQLKLPSAITKFCSLSKGLVLVTGPTGSGKSTTLAAMIDLINKDRSDHILTVEDPIEFVHPQQKCLINQREVHKHTGSFSRALKAALREDPDIVLIGEMRDLETVAIAIETAETGHLVFGTLHTNTAVSTIDRIIDQFPTDQQSQIRMMLAASLRGVVAQTLLKKKTGGRAAAHEILVTSDAVSAMIREGKNHMIANHMQSQKSDGNLMLNDSLLKLVKDGVVDIDEAMRKSVDRSSFIEAAKRQGGPQPTLPGATPKPPAGGNGGGR
jgi:twitching motility protein PilT